MLYHILDIILKFCILLTLWGILAVLATIAQRMDALGNAFQVMADLFRQTQDEKGLLPPQSPPVADSGRPGN